MKTMYKQIKLFIIISLVSTPGTYSQTISEELPHFDKIVVSPHINLNLEQGENEKIVVSAENVNLDKINIKVKHGTLRIYLDDWFKEEKIKEGKKTHKQDRYKNTKVYVSVTYNQLKTLVVKGEENMICNSRIENEIFRLTVYGEAKVSFQSLEVKNLKTKLYGENELVVQSGEIATIKSKLYGENYLDLINVHTQKTKCTSFGESEFACNSEEKLKMCSFGESEFKQYGSAKIHKMIVLGENKCSYAGNRQ